MLYIRVSKLTVNFHRVYDATHHQKYKNGEWTEDQVFKNFLKSFDSPTDPDGKVTKKQSITVYPSTGL